MYLFGLATLGCLLLTVVAQINSTFTPTRPPSIPLAVKNPYLSTWLPAGNNPNGGYLPGTWPTFWRGQVLGWTGLVRVDGKAFTWMGNPKDFPKAEQVAAEYTSTKSKFTIQADGKVLLKITFLSPITPKDLRRQSLIFSYMQVEIASIDGREHDVDLYTDISVEWVSGDVRSKAEWSTGSTPDGVKYHKVWKQDQWLFNEWDDQAEWGNIYYATDDSISLSYQSGSDDDVRGAFSRTGKLENSQDTDFRAINDRWPVFAYAVDLGTVGTKPTSNLFTIGLCQDDAIQFSGDDVLKPVPSLWKDEFGNDTAALSFFHKDYTESSKLSSELDDQISRDSKAAGGDNYAILTTLATRQAFAAAQLVGTKDKHYLFLKEISSNGNMQTIDVIYPATPIFYYTNPELVKLMLDPHFINQESGHYPNKSAMHDLGTHYPNATGHDDGQDESMPVEECGNNMIMMLAYAQLSGNIDYIKAHYKILKQWAEYLIDFSLLPAEQLSTDDFAGHMVNQTNLALKGIVGLGAMARMSSLVNESFDAQKYASIAKDYITRWSMLALDTSTDLHHTTLNYGNVSTYSLLYNLYNDRLLNLSLVPESVYAVQDKFYPSVAQTYGVPLDTRNKHWTKSDWQIFCAAVAGPNTRKMFVDAIAKWVGETSSRNPMSDLYNTHDGTQVEGIDFKARPVVGGLFALLLVDGEGYRAPQRVLE
ncbi:hypothetical protein HBH56_108920 [Parastagonospora nodorum]|uniref:Glutaminase A n=1 Tax=Phaeosphaeria nodorum (strain SN15 / ATCC MYA-4574 / FGSC 10173) TaxID=321614 RepID=A0A7U2FI25_PHANO|nr:hypothetical protein HBH56_108920 [Parastagonospora nodorum]QRD03236.1 hypothetical protein JI435_100060 [Parastagonospora nodorum SN15]KAH3922274.1 hypothetical protein HBH54_226020 [Parastagonospora nodorum]KAH3974234.1 hypothetical protein HBH51_093620 [Parastagonospora nodorum]KAH4138687.1 hypothetical protein HBH45_104250 [Parastagonospora nodorum]